jgi:hypothetical protein
VYGLFCGIVNLMIVEFTIVAPRVFLLFLGAVLLISVFSLFLKKKQQHQKDHRVGDCRGAAGRSGLFLLSTGHCVGR